MGFIDYFLISLYFIRSVLNFYTFRFVAYICTCACSQPIRAVLRTGSHI